VADSPDAGWWSDPTDRHELRYHDGSQWTAYTCDNGIVGVDGQRPHTGPGPTGAGDPAPADPLARGPAPQLAWQPTLQPPVAGAPPVPVAPPIAPGPTGGGSGGRHRAWLLVVLGIAVLEAVAIVVLSVALVGDSTPASSRPIGSIVPATGSYPSTRGSVVYTSTFGHDDSWTTGSIDANTTASVSGGQYVVQASDHYHHALLTPYGDPHLGISVQATVGGFPQHDVSMGVGCQSGSRVDPPLIYQLIVYPDGSWWIEEARLTGSITILTSGQTPPLSTTATLQLVCVLTQVSSAQETTQLVAFVNGSQVAAIGDQITHLSPGGYVPLLVVGTFGQHVQVGFSGVVVRSIYSATAGPSSVAPPKLSASVRAVPARALSGPPLRAAGPPTPARWHRVRSSDR